LSHFLSFYDAYHGIGFSETVLRVHEVYDATRRDHTIATVTEICTGSHLHSAIPYPEPRAKKIIAQILDALQYMHQRGLFHNSLTTENSMFHWLLYVI
jgi:serine/threonine protein kinase